MALDRNCTNRHYLTGRLIAVIEKSNRKSLTASQMDNIYQNPSLYLAKYDENKLSYEAEKREIIDKLPADGVPEKVSPQDASRMWVGYHHQCSAMPDVEVERHTPEKVSAVRDNMIKELKK